MNISAVRSFLGNSSMTLQEDDVDNIVKQLEADTTSGLNRFAPIRTRTIMQGKASNEWLSTTLISILKARSVKFSIFIAHHATRFFTTGRFPSAWKVDLLIPLMKKPGLDVEDFKNCRPISTLITIRLRPKILCSQIPIILADYFH